MNTSQTSIPQTPPQTRASRSPDPILDDLRAFAKEKGIVGGGVMGREELVESLRQRYLLETMLTGRCATR